MGNRTKNIVGQRYGRLTVLERDFEDPRVLTQKASFWKCQCDCGNIITVNYSNLSRGQTKSCGCLSKESRNSLDDLSGKKFGRITVLELDKTYRHEHNIKNHSAYWLCKCDCGKIFSTTRERLLNKKIQSCGCLVSKGEQKITKYLENSKINFISQYCIPEFRFEETNGIPRFDYAIFSQTNELLFLLEYHGKQHYCYEDSFWDTEENYYKRIKRDKEKEKYCESNNIALEIISYKDYPILENKLKEVIRKYLVEKR